MNIKLPWKAIFAYSLLTGAGHVQASDLDDTVRSTILQAINRPDEEVKVSIERASGLNDCDAPSASLPYPVPERGGRISVSVQCDGQAPRYIQVTVGIITQYVASTTDIAQGQVITASMLRLAKGDRASLPATVLIDPAAAIGQQATRHIKAGGFVQASSVKPQVLVARNARVTVVAAGAGFAVRHDGTALDAGAKDAEIRVRLLGGGIVKAVVVDKNTVGLPL
ncbi:flagellar basal body P-ring formation chaperone FlgA [Pseudomonas serbica]|uniref:flagellar basal body P-ring formation chaperone FlgA n=1 Tax=Pseudomonas serbica TaxID=2965074 RepID=UPI00237BA100|nr:flagellar basal body P-ring formation chaperone FlgA [Pseudomonas serbica]